LAEEFSLVKSPTSLNLNTGDLNFLGATDSSDLSDAFEFVLPENFIVDQNPVLSQVDAWYSARSISGLQFTFING